MNELTSATEYYDDEIDLRELLRVVWAGKWLIIGSTVTAVVITIILALLLPDIYRAEALLAPNDRDDAGGLSSLAAQYGGLASLAGISLEGGSSDRTALGLEVLKSRKFISEFIDRRDILVPLVASTSWNIETGELAVDPGDYDIATKKWVRHASPPRKSVPSYQEAYEEFIEILSVTQDRNTGFVKIAIEHRSPVIAKQWVDWLIADLNSSIMRQDVAEAEQAIAYLNKQISETSLADLQSVFFRLIEEQTKTVMLARVSDEYLLKTLDPAIAPEEAAKPNRSMIVFLGLVLGFFLGLTLVILLNKLGEQQVSQTANDKAR